MATAHAGYVVLTLKVFEGDGQFVSECPELGIASCGDTMEEAFENIREAATVEVSLPAHPREYVSPQPVLIPA